MCILRPPGHRCSLLSLSNFWDFISNWEKLISNLSPPPTWQNGMVFYSSSFWFEVTRMAEYFKSKVLSNMLFLFLSEGLRYKIIRNSCWQMAKPSGVNSNRLYFLPHMLKKRLISMEVLQLFVPTKVLSLRLHKILTENNCLLTVSPEALLCKIYILTVCFISMNRSLEKIVQGTVSIQPM